MSESAAAKSYSLDGYVKEKSDEMMTALEAGERSDSVPSLVGERAIKLVMKCEHNENLQEGQSTKHGGTWVGIKGSHLITIVKLAKTTSKPEAHVDWIWSALSGEGQNLYRCKIIYGKIFTSVKVIQNISADQRIVHVLLTNLEMCFMKRSGNSAARWPTRTSASSRRSARR